MWHDIDLELSLGLFFLAMAMGILLTFMMVQ